MPLSSIECALNVLVGLVLCWGEAMLLHHPLEGVCTQARWDYPNICEKVGF
jgi:hypothetical protein